MFLCSTGGAFDYIAQERKGEDGMTTVEINFYTLIHDTVVGSSN